MSDIPVARALLEEIASKAPPKLAAEIQSVVNTYLYRKPFVRRAPPTKRAMTPALKARIRQLAAANPNMHMQDIADAVGVNPGRVSEVLNP